MIETISYNFDGRSWVPVRRVDPIALVTAHPGVTVHIDSDGDVWHVIPDRNGDGNGAVYISDPVFRAVRQRMGR